MVFRVFISSITEELTDTELDKIIFRRQDIVMHINEPHFLATEVMSISTAAQKSLYISHEARA